MRNKMMKVISGLLLAAMVVPLIVEGFEMSRYREETEAARLRQESRADLLYADPAALRADFALPMQREQGALPLEGEYPLVPMP